MLVTNAIFVVLLAIASVQAFVPRASSIKLSSRLFAKEAPIPEGETEDEMRVRLKAKARKMMYNENGVAYAPWVTRQINEEAIIEGLILKEKGGPAKKKTSILDRGEIESSEGMKWRMNGDQVDLAWVTGVEDDNKGYIVEKRPSYGGDFQEVASFREVAGLRSKGQSGGRYEWEVDRKEDEIKEEKEERIFDIVNRMLKKIGIQLSNSNSECERHLDFLLIPICIFIKLLQKCAA